MIKVEFSINKSIYKIACQEGEKDKIINLAKKIDKKISQLEKSLKNADKKTLLAICCLNLQDEIDANFDATDDEKTSIEIEKISKKIDEITKKIEEY